MKFLLDENFPKSAAQLLDSRGHDVLDIRGTVNEGIGDYELFAMAQENKAILISTDRDFFHTIPHLFPNHHGVVVIALRQPNRHAILNRLSWFLDNLSSQTLFGKTYLLRDKTFTIFPSDS